MAKPHLQKQLKELMKNPVGGVKVEPAGGSDIMKWDIWLLGPDQTPYEGGCFHANLTFTEEFPMKPPEMRFLSDFWHPNVYDNGVVCISILHPPGTDQMNALESAAMRWTPVQTLEKVLLSVISMIADPDPAEAGAPANVDALVEWRKNRPKYIQRCRAIVEKANKALPSGFELPSKQDSKPAPVPEAEFTLYGDDEEGDDDDCDVDDGDDDDCCDDDEEAMEASNDYDAEISQLQAMGIRGDADRFRECLRKYKGDVERVVEAMADEG